MVFQYEKEIAFSRHILENILDKQQIDVPIYPHKIYYSVEQHINISVAFYQFPFIDPLRKYIKALHNEYTTSAFRNLLKSAKCVQHISKFNS